MRSARRARFWVPALIAAVLAAEAMAFQTGGVPPPAIQRQRDMRRPTAISPTIDQPPPDDWAGPVTPIF
jgi:hypothetical protein